MDLIAALRRSAFARPHLLVLQGAHGTAARIAVERWARIQGWPLAASPVDADVVVVCGAVDGELAHPAERLVNRVPLPRAVVHVHREAGGGDLHALFAAGQRTLLDWAAQEQLAAGLPEPREEPDHAMQDHAPDVDHGGTPMDHGDMDMDMGHDGMAMDMEAGGLPLAMRAEDRDGLKLDVLHVPLGPLLRAWPARLTLSLTLQGDVVQEAKVERSTAAGAWVEGSWWDEPWRRSLTDAEVSIAEAERHRAASHLDSLTRLLLLAGADGQAQAAALLRDAALGGEDVAHLRAAAARLRRRVERSRLLRHSIEGLGILGPHAAEAAGVTGPALRAAGVAADLRQGTPGYAGFQPVVGQVGDVWSRCRQWLAEVEQSLALAAAGDGASLPAGGPHEGPRGRVEPAGGGSAALVRTLPDLVVGQELAAVRLIVASLDPDGDDPGIVARSGGELAHA